MIPSSLKVKLIHSYPKPNWRQAVAQSSIVMFGVRSIWYLNFGFLSATGAAKLYKSPPLHVLSEPSSSSGKYAHPPAGVVVLDVVEFGAGCPKHSG